MIVPFPAGGQADLAARPVAQALEQILGKSVIVDNRAGGAGGSIGNAAAARAEPDGYTLLMTLSSLAVLPEADRLFDRPPVYEVSQFAPIARVLADPTLLAVPASAPWKTLQDFVDDAKKRPGEIPYGSSGPYGTLHVAMEMFAASAGIKLLHIPFRGAGPALNAMLTGTVQALASAPGTLKQQVDDGKMRVLANWGAERIASFPDLPTFKELGYKDVEFYIWAGLFAQSALPAPIMTRLREAMAQAVKSPEVIKTFETAGSPVAYMDAPEFSKFVEADSRAPGRGGEEDRQGGVGQATTLSEPLLKAHFADIDPFGGDQFGHARRRDAHRAVDRARRRHHLVERLQRHVAIDRQRRLQSERADAADFMAGDIGDFVDAEHLRFAAELRLYFLVVHPRGAAGDDQHHPLADPQAQRLGDPRRLDAIGFGGQRHRRRTLRRFRSR